MSKPQEGNPLTDRLAALAKSWTLTRQEQAMVTAILLSMLVGAVVMHWRREYRVSHPAVASPELRHGERSGD
jgi:hypothetical protein